MRVHVCEWVHACARVSTCACIGRVGARGCTCAGGVRNVRGECERHTIQGGQFGQRRN